MPPAPRTPNPLRPPKTFTRILWTIPQTVGSGEGAFPSSGSWGHYCTDRPVSGRLVPRQRRIRYAVVTDKRESPNVCRTGSAIASVVSVYNCTTSYVHLSSVTTIEKPVHLIEYLFVRFLIYTRPTDYYRTQTRDIDSNFIF